MGGGDLMLNLSSYFSLYLFDREDINMKTILKWITNRSIEPSSWAAAAAAIVGVSVLIDNFWVAVAGIAVAAVSIVLRERGLI